MCPLGTLITITVCLGAKQCATGTWAQSNYTPGRGCAFSRGHYEKVWNYKTDCFLQFKCNYSQRPQLFMIILTFIIKQLNFKKSVCKSNFHLSSPKKRKTPSCNFFCQNSSIQNLVKRITGQSRGRITQKQSQHIKKRSIITSYSPRIYTNWNLL